MNKICFVISPIGDEGSDVRQLADDLFEIVITPAVKAYGFDVVRADKIARSGVVTDDIVDLIQNAALCIVDLTGFNANVYYECGRRHETGKPFIQLMQKGEKIPFDLAGIRTIFYDLSSARNAHQAAEEIERYVLEFERSGYGSESSGTSLGSLAAAVDRIDRKLDSFRAQGTHGSLSSIQRPSGGLQSLLLSPTATFAQAIEQGDLETIAAIHPRLVSVNPKSPETFMSATVLAVNGYELGAQSLESILDDLDRTDEWPTVVINLRRYHELRGTVEAFVASRGEFLAGLMDDITALPSPADRATIANQLGIMYSTLEEEDRAAWLTQRAVDLDPSELVYHVNLASVLSRLDMDRAVPVVERYIALDGIDEIEWGLELAIEVYTAVKRIDDARRVFDRLSGVDPARAATQTRP